MIGAGTSIVGGILGSNSAKKAAELQRQAADRSQQIVADATAGGQKGVGDSAVVASNFVNDSKDKANTVLNDVYQQQLGYLSPYQTAGTTALNSLSSMNPYTLPTAEEVEKTPGYQFTLAQGMKALQQAAAARGAVGSSGTLKSLGQFNTGLASTYYQNAVSNSLAAYGTNFNRLNSLANYGQNANAQAINAGTNYGNQTSANDMNAGLFQGNTTNRAAEFGANLGMEGAKARGDFITQGSNAQAAGVMGSGNAWTGALNNIGNIAGNFGGYLASGGEGSSFRPYNSANPWGGLPPTSTTPFVPPPAPVPNMTVPAIPNIPNAPGATPTMGLAAKRTPNYLTPPSVAPVG